jgi:hypothetical protein
LVCIQEYVKKLTLYIEREGALWRGFRLQLVRKQRSHNSVLRWKSNSRANSYFLCLFVCCGICSQKKIDNIHFSLYFDITAIEEEYQQRVLGTSFIVKDRYRFRSQQILMFELRRIKIKFFNYLRMSGSTFNDLLKLEWEEI